MVKVIIGDLFESNAQTIVNTVNCIGVMGKGIALQFKKRFPAMYKEYVIKCNEGKVKLGRPYLYKSVVSPWILNFPTKDHWRSLTNIQDIIDGLEYLLNNYKNWGITSLAVPPLGAGLGQLEWKIIGPILYKYLKQMDIPVELYAPFGTPTDQIELSFLINNNQSNQMVLKTPKSDWIQPGWVALVEIINRVQSQPYHWPVGRTSFQKMAYISKNEGLPLDIEFLRGEYGPYAPDMKKIVSLLINNGVILEKKEGQMFRVFVGPTFETALKSYSSDLAQWENVISKVSDLFMRVNTRQSEIIATIIYVHKELAVKHQSKPTELEVLNEVIKWKQNRPILGSEFACNIRNLAVLGWLDVIGSENLPVSDMGF